MKMPKEVEKLFKINGIILLIVIILGIILQRVELYFGYTIGALTSMLVMYMITSEVYKMVYEKEKIVRNPFGYFKRLGVIIVGLLIVSLGSKKYFPNFTTNNIIAAGLGLMSFKIILYVKGKFVKSKK